MKCPHRNLVDEFGSTTTQQGIPVRLTHRYSHPSTCLQPPKELNGKIFLFLDCRRLLVPQSSLGLLQSLKFRLERGLLLGKETSLHLQRPIAVLRLLGSLIFDSHSSVLPPELVQFKLIGSQFLCRLAQCRCIHRPTTSTLRCCSGFFLL